MPDNFSLRVLFHICRRDHAILPVFGVFLNLLLFLPLPCFNAFTFAVPPGFPLISLTCCSVCSMALIKSTACCNVKSFHRSNLSRILSSRILSTLLSRKISSGVILSCWQFFAIVLNSVRYDAMLSPGSWLRLLNR